MSVLFFILTAFRAIFIPAQCQDSEFSYSREELSGILQQAQSYFNREIDNGVSFNFILSDVVTLEHPTSFYGHNSTSRKDENLYMGVIEACRKSGIDFSGFDNDGDGEVENVFLIMPGKNERDGGGEDGIWPHRYFINECGGSFTICGKTINSYAVSTESGGLESLCHEFAHVLGLPDLYDTDGPLSGGVSSALGGLTLMEDKLDYPAPLCAVERDILGLGEAVTVTKGHYQVKERCRYILNTLTEGDFYLLEKYDGRGIAIYHINRSSSDAGYSDYYRKNLTAAQRWEVNEINCNPEHQCACLIGFFPTEEVDCFGPEDCPLSVSGITADGFDVIEPITVSAVDVYQDAVIIRWTALCPESYVSLDKGPLISVSGNDGMFSYTFEQLSPATEYSVEIGTEAFSQRAEFKTKAYNSNVSAYIYLSGAERTQSGAFVLGTRIPLRVYNAPDAVSVRWTFDGREIQCDSQGYYTLDGNGVLRTELERADGTVEIIEKRIYVE